MRIKRKFENFDREDDNYEKHFACTLHTYKKMKPSRELNLARLPQNLEEKESLALFLNNNPLIIEKPIMIGEFSVLLNLDEMIDFDMETAAVTFRCYRLPSNDLSKNLQTPLAMQIIPRNAYIFMELEMRKLQKENVNFSKVHGVYLTNDKSHIIMISDIYDYTRMDSAIRSFDLHSFGFIENSTPGMLSVVLKNFGLMKRLSTKVNEEGIEEDGFSSDENSFVERKVFSSGQYSSQSNFTNEMSNREQ